MSSDRTVFTVEVTPKAPWFPDFGEAWRYRWMAVALARRGIISRYTQTVLGPVWFILQPIILAGVLSLVMGAILGAPSDGMPYVIFAGTGTVLWVTFNRSVTETGMSLVSAGPIFSKVFFPRIIVPISALIVASADFLPVYVLLVLMIAAFGLFSGWLVLLMPVFLALTLMLTFAVGLWLTILDSYFRDVRLTVPFILQFVFYVSPVIYGATAIPARFQLLFKLNPLVGLLNGFRWSLVAGAPPPSLFEIVWILIVISVLMISGLLLFARYERIVVDRI